MDDNPLAATSHSKVDAASPSPAETMQGGQATPSASPQSHGAAPPQSSAATNESWVGKTLGKYEITAVLGQGGMGLVLKGRDPLIERDVAIKLLNEHLASDLVALGRFLAEAKSAGKLNHPNVVSIYEIGQEGLRFFLVMECVPGGSLNDWVAARGGCSVLEATQAMIDACKGVAAAHAAGLIHRDIKPANFMRAADGSIKVADFGLAKAVEPEAGRQLTQAGLVVGTPFFMSPEQCQTQPVDARSDVYSLGATYYALLTGKNPYHDSDSIPRVMYNHCHGPIPDPRADSGTTPAACSQIVARAMAKSPDDRYQSAGQMLADLEAVAATLSGQRAIELPSRTATLAALDTARFPKPIARSRRPLLLAAAAMLVAGGLGGAAFLISRGSNDGGRASPAGSSAVAPSEEPIKVGVLHSLSGAMANSELVVVDATLFAIDEINQAGGVLGRPVKAIVADGRSDPEIFAREARRLIVDEQVSVVFGCWTSAARKTVRPIFEEHDHLLIYPLQYEGCETSPNILYLGSAPNQQILPAIEWAVREAGKKRFFLVGSDYVFPRVANAVLKDDLARLGAEVAGEEYLPLNNPDVRPMVEKIVAAKPDMLLNTINGDANTAFFRALRAAGVRAADMPCLSFSVGEQELRSLSAADVEGDYAAWTYFETIDTAENKAFVERFHDKYPQRPVTSPMVAAYDGVRLWAQAVQAAESIDPKQFRRELLRQRLKSPGGELRVDADSQHIYKTPRVGQVQADGTFRIVWTASGPVRPEPYPATRTAEEWRAFIHDLYTSWGNRWSAPEVPPLAIKNP